MNSNAIIVRLFDLGEDLQRQFFAGPNPSHTEFVWVTNIHEATLMTRREADIIIEALEQAQPMDYYRLDQ